MDVREFIWVHLLYLSVFDLLLLCATAFEVSHKALPYFGLLLLLSLTAKAPCRVLSESTPALVVRGMVSLANQQGTAMTNEDKNQNNEWEIIHAYTRAQAIDDGVLVDVSEVAREAGFTMPVAVTSGVYAKCIEVPESTTGQDIQGRLWDVLTMLRHAIRSSKCSGSSLDFELLVKQSDNAPAELLKLNSVCGPGDNAEPVITIMLPGED